MKIVLGMPFLECPPNPAFLSGRAIGSLGRAAEDAGFAAVSLTEHPAPSERWRLAGGHDALDPFVGLSFVAAATSRLRLLTYLVVLPYRNPFLLAKSVASLDVLSGGRVELGLGAGYQKSEFHTLGVDFEERNRLFDEALEVLPLAWSGEPVEYQGLHFGARDAACHPRPAQRPHPPLWLGGNSKLTRRRVVDHGTGWMPMPNSAATAATLRSPVLETMDQLAGMLTDCKEYADSVSLPGPTEIMYVLPGIAAGDGAGAFAAQLELARQARDVGVTWLSAGGHATSVDDMLRLTDRFQSAVIAPLASDE
jgi:probable F420-dependent oxidoreductase